MISQFKEKVNDFYTERKSDVFTAALIFLVGMIGFGLGRLSVIMPKKEPLKIIENGVPAVSSKSASDKPDPMNSSAFVGKLFASKNGSAYYFAWCSSSIKEENKIFFDGEEDAIAAGYRLAKNCEK
jgi:hypothetical protein